MSPDERREIFARHPFFGSFSPGEIDAVIAHAHPLVCAKGEVLFCKGDPGRGLLAVMRGTVKISVLSEDGREIVLNLMRDGDIFGEIALLDGQPRSADATALTECELLTVDRRDFLPLLREKPDLALRLMELLCQRLRHTSEQVEDLMFLDLPSRLAKVLLRLAGPETHAIRITQKELGEIIGMSRESTNKQLRAWEERGWVRLEKGGVVITNPAALSRHASR
jgi:CRP/FNR family transcriptional regulator, cyclic AMP receptor protein